MPLLRCTFDRRNETRKMKRGFFDASKDKESFRVCGGWEQKDEWKKEG